MNHAHAPADILAAAESIRRFAGKNVSSRHPIGVTVGARSSQDILVFQDLVLKKVNIGRIRNHSSDAEFCAYLQRDTQLDAIFYREKDGVPTERAQRFMLDRLSDERRRHFMPLILVALHHPLEVLATQSGIKLLPEFVELIGARAVDISSAGPQVPVWKTLWTLFLAAATRRSQITVDPDAALLMEEALRANATISHEVVMEVAKDAKKSAERLGLTAITRDVLWESLPRHFREAIQPADAMAH